VNFEALAEKYLKANQPKYYVHLAATNQLGPWCRSIANRIRSSMELMLQQSYSAHEAREMAIEQELYEPYDEDRTIPVPSGIGSLPMMQSGSAGEATPSAPTI